MTDWSMEQDELQMEVEEDSCNGMDCVFEHWFDRRGWTDNVSILEIAGRPAHEWEDNLVVEFEQTLLDKKTQENNHNDFF